MYERLEQLPQGDLEKLTDVLWFDICVNKVALVVKILKTEKHLLRDDSHEVNSNSGLLMTLYERKEVLA